MSWYFFIFHYFLNPEPVLCTLWAGPLTKKSFHIISTAAENVSELARSRSISDRDLSLAKWESRFIGLPCPSKKNVNLWLDRSRRPGGVGSCALDTFSGSIPRVWDCLETFWKRFVFENKRTRWKTVVSKKGASDFFLHQHEQKYTYIDFSLYYGIMVRHNSTVNFIIDYIFLI